MNFLDTGGSWPSGDSFHFDWIHMHLAISDDHPKVFHFVLVELAFTWFQEQIQFH